MTKMNDIRKMNESELNTLLSEKRETVRGFRFGTGGRDVRAKRSAKKEIARALTELTVRKLQGKPVEA
ncbi:hypothetical protein A2392_02515 [Candidatus Kaiserbacteria bacterium RIFOXYB1_FULL_46_14]|uniref:50S ribosomal protein L29 n=1 Tax=Candidatus Kaiserbacteria bacterium RIFOXYB1_FULL_46_14 TaxID=1798531 RepID=A0A1F6FID1_9BACT|nr:MAG: hypothetical protein A2392_02515 [Candidatus Kaiserbacteria bacterium RIFOXYB1_FULL_46_14]